MQNLSIEEIETQAYDLYEKGEYKQAFDKFMQLATDYTCPYAMQHLAIMYVYGEGVEQDYDKSMEWDKKSIALGNSTSMNNLAITYRMIGDIVQSKYWFEQAIQAGNIDSALPLAKLYMVSEKETDTIKKLLQQMLNGAEKDPYSFCEADIEEATMLLEQYKLEK